MSNRERMIVGRSAATAWRLLCLALLLAGQPLWALEIVSDGKSDYVIVGRPGDAAVQDLQAFIEAMSGARLPIVESSIAEVLVRRIVVGAPTEEELGPQEYRLRVDGETVWVFAAGPMGASHGVYGLLDDIWGCRFLTPTESFIPERPTLSLPPDLDRRHGPSVQDRLPGPAPHTSIYNADWRRRNRVSAELSGYAIHNIYRYLPPATHAEAHPEWYPLNKAGQREPGCDWVCWTNEAMLQELTAKVREEMAKQPPEKLIPVGQGDGFSHPCHCAPCRELVESYQSEAAPQVWGLNRLLQMTSDEFPLHQVVTFAYFQTAVPPINQDKRLEPHPSLHFTYVRMGDAMKPLGDADKERLLGWLSLTPNINIWSWSVGFRNALCPFPNYQAMAEDTKWYADNVRGVMHQLYANGEWGLMREWLLARVAWDASLDVEETQQDFLRHYYGEKAAGPMWEILHAYQQIAANTEYTFNAVYDSPPENVKRKLFPPPVMERLQGMWQAAIASQPDPVYLARIQETLARSFAMLYFSDAPAMQRVQIDGQPWILPGGNAFLAEPARLLGDILKTTILWEWYGPELGRRIFLNNAGGDVAPVVANDQLQLGFCLALDGALASLVDLATGEELMALGPQGNGQLTGLRHMVLSDKSGTEHFISTQQDDKRTTVVLSSQVVTNAWMAFNALRNERTFTLEPGRRGFTVTSCLFADSSLPGFGLFTIPNYRNDTFRLYLDNPIYDTSMRAAFKLHAPDRVAVAAMTPNGVEHHDLTASTTWELTLPPGVEAGGQVRIHITGISSTDVLELVTGAADWLTIRVVHDPVRQELVVECKGPKKAAVKDLRVPTGELAITLLTPAEARQLLPPAD